MANSKPVVHVRLAEPALDARQLLDPIDVFLYKRLSYSELDKLRPFKFIEKPGNPIRISRRSVLEFDTEVSIVLIFAILKNKELVRHEFGFSSSVEKERTAGMLSVQNTLNDIMPTADRMVVIVSNSSMSESYKGSRAHLYEVLDNLPPISR